MEARNITFQRVNSVQKDPFQLAYAYYQILFILNGIKLTERELQLIAFTAVKGNISYKSIREEFCASFKSSLPTMNNIISKLKRLKIMVKDGTKVKVNPVILLDFQNKDVVLQANLKLDAGYKPE
jgi:hypothetical protein